MKTFTSLTQTVGQTGEDIACNYLIRHGYTIFERNFTRKWGEIDIVAAKEGTLCFIEVKSVTRESQSYRPEDMVHPWKQRKIMRTIETYIADRQIGKWRFDIACVFLNMETRRAKVRVLEDIILV